MWPLSLLLLLALEPGEFRVPADLALTLVASEPNVVDPVALTFDEQGRMFVVEMRDYPYGIGPERKPGGTVRLLEDLDGDGKFEKASLFAEGLSFPTSIAPWKGGVVVAAPPEIIYLRDADGDGKAEVRRVLFDGFTLGVTDSNVNGLRWGVDGRLHGVNGGNGGEIRSLIKPGPTVKLGRADFSFDPEHGDFTRTFQTSGGFGLVFDEWGRSFSTYNIDHIQQRFFPLRYLERNAHLPPREATLSISDHGEMARIFPISTPETRVNHPEQAGHFSSAGGMGFYNGAVLVGDVVGNLIHRDALQTNGCVFTARRHSNELSSEFLASKDNAFRPTAMETGPDGALYIADMQRDVIEHPDYIPEKVKQKLNLRAGEDRGRIYRLAPRNFAGAAKPNLRRAPAHQLVRTLSHTNQWWRVTAQRLLIERGDPITAGFVETEMKVGLPIARMHSLWTLNALGALTERLLSDAVRDNHPGVRESAIALIERWPTNSPALWNEVIRAIKDDHPRVRLQAALSLGALNDPGNNTHLRELLIRDAGDPVMRLACLSSIRNGAVDVLADVLESKALSGHPEALRELADLAGADAAKKKQIETLARVIRDQPEVLDGLNSGVKRGLTRAEEGGALDKTLSFQNYETFALRRTLGLPNANIEAKGRDAVRLLQFAPATEAVPKLLSHLDSNEDQRAAFESLRGFRGEAVAKGLLERWRRLAPGLRVDVLNHLLSRREFHDPLLGAIESNQVTLGELNLDLEQRRVLLRKSSPTIQERAAKLISDEEYSNRKAIVDEWLAKLPAEGKTEEGRVIFEKLCAQCHKNGVGPDLASVAHRSVEDLLSNILDPNMAINPLYISFEAKLKNGDIETGILANETPDSVTLRQAGGRELVLQRTQMETFASKGASLMPEGLENGLSPEDLRNLIAYLQNPK